MIDADSPTASVVVGERNSIRYTDFGSLDLRVSREFTLSRGDLTVFAEVTNALNRHNPCCTDYSYDYVDGWLTLERDERHWLPLVPSIGVLWRY